jgi:hypothetical protein
MTIDDEIIKVINETYNSMYPEESESARSRGQRLRRAKERAESENPQLFKLRDKVTMNSPEGDIEKYGVSAGSQLKDDESSNTEEGDDYYDSPKGIVFSHKTIGGDQSKGGKTKFRRWLENVYIAKRPELKEAIDGVSGKKKKKMMERISYGVRKNIAEYGLEIGSASKFDSKGNTLTIEYKSGKTWNATYPKGGYK